MARKKAAIAAPVEDCETVDLTAESRAAALIRKAFGDDIVVNGQKIVDASREVVSVGPALDSILGGGVLTGTLITLAGDSGCGKTTTVLDMAASWQALGRRVFYIAAEHRIYKMNLQGIRGLDAAKLEIVSSARGQILTAEKFLHIAETIIKNEQNALIIVDSFSILSDSGEMTMPDYDNSPPVGGSSRLLSRFCKRMTPVLPINNNTLVGIAHVYANIGGRKKFAVSLPSKVKFLSSTRLVCDYFSPLHKDGERSAWGQEVHWRCERTPLGSPNGKAISILKFGRGIDKERELIAQGLELGLVNQKGAYYYLDFLGDDVTGIQGLDKMCTHLMDNPDILAKLGGEVRRLSFEEA